MRLWQLALCAALVAACTVTACGYLAERYDVPTVTNDRLLGGDKAPKQ